VLNFAERPASSVYPVLQPREQGGGLGQGAPSEKQAGSPPTKQRTIPSTPIRTLDAPDLVNDYYLNLISWSAANVLAVALGQAVYLWNASTGAIQHLLTLPGADDIVTSVRWAQDSCSGDCSGSGSSSSIASSYNNSSSSSAAHLIAVGTSSGAVELWDCAAVKRVRILRGHSARAGALSWRDASSFSSGSRDSAILQRDVRVSRDVVATYAGHQQEVCGLEWNGDGRTLASGGNENYLCLWGKCSIICYVLRVLRSALAAQCCVSQKVL
jgi:cell division cycle 20, cofactor of APC complex